MDPVSLITGILIAGIVGFVVGKKYSGDSQEQTQLRQQLDEKQQELDAFRQKVNQHFEKTADLFNQVSDSYQSLYEHMARGSGQLCATQTFRALPGESKVAGAPEKAIASDKEQNKAQMFSPDKLYNAHEHRNQQEEEKAEAKPEKKPAKKHARDKNVVDLEKAKEEKREPALDYAIKEKGVINHNSLNRDGVRTN